MANAFSFGRPTSKARSAVMCTMQIIICHQIQLDGFVTRLNGTAVERQICDEALRVVQFCLYKLRSMSDVINFILRVHYS
jgi:hypothetical protein